MPPSPTTIHHPFAPTNTLFIFKDSFRRMISPIRILTKIYINVSKGQTFNQKSTYSERTAPMPTWKRMANMAGTVDVGKFFRFAPSRNSCKKTYKSI